MFEIIVKVIPTGEHTWEVTKASFQLNGKEIVSFSRNYPSYPHCIIEDTLGWVVYHSPSSYMKWAVTRVYLNGTYEHTDFGGLSWAQLFPGRESCKDRTDPIICFASFAATPDKQHLIISGCPWGGPYEDICFNITQWDTPKVVNVHGGYENTELDIETINDNTIEIFNDHIVYETESRDDVSQPLYKWSLAHLPTEYDKEQGRKPTPYIITEYAQVTSIFKWYFKTNTYEFVSSQRVADTDNEEYEKDGWRHKNWPLETPNSIIWEDDCLWYKEHGVECPPL